MSNTTMKAKDAVSAKEGKGYLTINGNRYLLMQLVDFESKIKLKIADVAVLGRRMMGHKVVGANGEWSAKLQFNQSILREAILEYKRTGTFPYFDIQVTNEDPTTSVGRQTVILKDCLLDGVLLSKLEADGDTIVEEAAGTFDDIEMPEKFNILEGMI